MLVPGERDISYTITKMGNKPSFPLDTLLGCLLANWEGYQLGGLKKKSYKILYSILAYLLPGRRGEMAPVRITWTQHHFTAQSILQT